MQLVRAARLFDGERTIEPANVLIDGGVIVDVGVRHAGELPTTELVDGTIVPGLIDCHQHLCFDGSGALEEQVRDIDDEALLARARRSAERALRGGVTTLRDLGDRGFVTLALRGDPALPTILAAGPPITTDGGHCWYLGGGCTGDEQLRRAVADRAEAGCDVVKIMVSGGFLTPTVPMWASQFTKRELALVVDEAHRRGLPVAAHCHGIGAITDAVDVGVDSIEHCTFFTERMRCEPSEDLLDRLARSPVVVSATIGRLPDAPLAPVIAANLPALRHVRRRLHEAGGTVVAGTDAGIDQSKPHDVVAHAMVELVEAGMTPAEALGTLTTVAARALGVDGHKGRLARGFDADVVVVDGDPLEHPTALTATAAVWRDGRRVV